SSASGMSDEHPKYSPDGRHLVWHAYDTKRSFIDQGHLRLHERRSGRERTLAPRLDRGTQHVEWNPDSRSLLFLIEDRGRTGLWRLALDSEAPVKVVAGGAISGYAISRDGGVIAYARASAMHPPALFAARADGSGERPIERLNRAILANHAFGE